MSAEDGRTMRLEDMTLRVWSESGGAQLTDHGARMIADEVMRDVKTIVALDWSGDEVATFTRQTDGSWTSGPVTSTNIAAFRLEDDTEIPAHFKH